MTPIPFENLRLPADVTINGVKYAVEKCDFDILLVADNLSGLTWQNGLRKIRWQAEELAEEVFGSEYSRHVLDDLLTDDDIRLTLTENFHTFLITAE